MTDLIAMIAQAWGWIGIRPKTVLERNAFGNLLVLDHDGQYWRICPEDLACTIVARTDEEYAALRANPDFQQDWEMTRLREVALSRIGPIADDRAYCLKLPSVLGGAYDASNIGEISLSELIAVSGDLAQQIRDVPAGATVRLRISQ